MSGDPSLEARVEALLRDPAAPAADWQAVLGELYQQYRTQSRLLERVTHISDLFQRAERDRGRNYASQLERKIRQIEKIVRISDRYQLMLHDLNERLTEISTHDELTGLPNRRFMQEKLHQAIAQIGREGGRFAIALADVDHFKDINDSAGHAAGDNVLSALARCIRTNLREYDLCARWGGEEFLLLFSGCGLAEAEGLAERIRRAVEEIDPGHLPAGIALSISLGVTEYHPAEGLDNALRNADLALYRAKAAGRNRVDAHPPRPASAS
jgi:diguanylate cyclase (GGDEF)-like protein